MTTDSSSSTILKGASITLVGTVIGMGLKFITRTFLARSLGPDEYGMLMIGVTVLYLLNSISNLGLGVSVARFISMHQHQEAWNRIKGLLIGTTTGVAGIGVIVGCGLVIGAEAVASFFFSNPDLAPLLRVFGIALPVLSVGNIFRGALRGFKRMDFIVYGEQGVRQVGLTIVAILALFGGIGAFGVSLGYLIVFVAMTIAFGSLLWRFTPVSRKWGDHDTKFAVGEVLNFSWPLVVSQQLSHTRQRADTLLIGYFATSASVGVFNVALPLAKLLQVILSSINRIYMPSVTGLFAAGEMDQLRSSYRRVARWTFYLTLPLYIVIIVNSEALLTVVFGAEYAEGQRALIILATGFFVNTITGSFGETLIAAGKTYVNMWIAVLAIVINIILNVVLIPKIGVDGAALAAAVSLASVAATGGGFLYAKYGIQPFTRHHVKGLLSVVPALILLLSLDSLLPTSWGIWMLPFVTVSMYVVFGTGLYLLDAFTAEEREIASSVLGRVRSQLP
ncbi:flippase [Salinibacter ruber]|uniref:flippase n=1 Tax=Salinibacter ruber TaxID=146919 RepID=UPI00216895E2|nr:flippase [Salinibacter ruber]MCS3683884.1 O-antigen/teichoic acid export membrane protein [Salinibacter ruber]